MAGALSLSATISTGSAEPTGNRDKARKIVAEGASLFDDGKFEEALRRYRAAQALYPSPKLYYNIAFAYRGMGKNAQAVAALERFLREAKDAAPEHADEARAEIGRLSPKVAFVGIASDTAAAEVLIDGTRVGTTLPSRTPVDPGPHEVLLRSRALGSRTKAFVAVAGKSLDLRIEFRTEPARPPTRPAGLAKASAGVSEARRTDTGSAAAQAEALIREATELRRAGQDARAYPLYLRAYETQTSPRSAAQLGLVEIQLGYWVDAEKHLTESLASPRDPWIASNRADLEASLAKAKAAIGEILVTGSPAGATVLVNRKPSGTLPLAIVRWGEGPANLEIRAPGYVPAVRSLIVVGGRREELPVTLERAATGPGVAPGSTEASRLADQTNPPASADSQDGRNGLSRLPRPLAFASGGLAAIAAGFSVYQTAITQKKWKEFENHRAPPIPGMSTTCGVDERNHGPLGCDAIYSDFKRAQRLAMAGYAATALLGVGAVVLFLSSSRAGNVDLACAPAAAGALCGLAF